MRIFYFSGTGNSYWAAREIAARFSGELHSITESLAHQEVMVEDSVVGFAFPTHMMDIPWLAKEFLLKLTLPENVYTFAVMTSNNGVSHGSFSSIDCGLAVHGQHLCAGFDLQMPGNCIASTAEQDRERLASAPNKIALICSQIEARVSNYTPNREQAGVDYVESSYFYGEKNPFKDLMVNSNCIGCSVCAQICPVHNIHVENGRARHGTNCTSCLACIHWCPRHATFINLDRFRDLRPYHHPEVELNEMFQSKTRG